LRKTVRSTVAIIARTKTVFPDCAIDFSGDNIERWDRYCPLRFATSRALSISPERHSLHPAGLTLDINQYSRNVARPRIPKAAMARVCGLIHAGRFQLGGWAGRTKHHRPPLRAETSPQALCEPALVHKNKGGASGEYQRPENSRTDTDCLEWVLLQIAVHVISPRSKDGSVPGAAKNIGGSRVLNAAQKKLFLRALIGRAGTNPKVVGLNLAIAARRNL
jgi:hypothetical protein